MGCIIYYVATVGVNLSLLFWCRSAVNLTATSVLPLFLLGLSIFQAAYFYKNRSKTDFNVCNTTDLSEDEWEMLSLSISASFRVSLPWYLPMIFFFSTLPKTLLSVLLFLLAFTGGAVWFRLRNRKHFQARMKRESDALEEQKKKESLGKFK